jgi:protein tyrosine/serine phosphatase
MSRPLQDFSLVALGARLLDVYDESVRQDDNLEILEECANEIADEIKARVPDASKRRALMDYHYKAWADTMPDTAASLERYFELRAMMTAHESS